MLLLSHSRLENTIHYLSISRVLTTVLEGHHCVRAKYVFFEVNMARSTVVDCV